MHLARMPLAVCYKDSAPVRRREFRDVHIESSLLEIEAQADARWIRDPFDRMEVIVEVVQV